MPLAHTIKNDDELQRRNITIDEEQNTCTRNSAVPYAVDLEGC